MAHYDANCGTIWRSLEESTGQAHMRQENVEPIGGVHPAASSPGPGTSSPSSARRTRQSRRPAPAGPPPLTRRSLTASRDRYDKAVAFGAIHNRLRDWASGSHPGYALAAWPKEYKEQVWLFTRDFTVAWTNNVRRARRQDAQAPPGRLRLLAHPGHPRTLVPHPQLPHLSRRPRGHRPRRHPGKALATATPRPSPI